MLDQTIIPTFNPELYYTRQLRGNTHYPIYQSGRGLGSRLFNIVKSVGSPLLKDVILPTVKEEAGQVLKDITSGVGMKNDKFASVCIAFIFSNFESDWSPVLNSRGR